MPLILDGKKCRDDIACTLRRELDALPSKPKLVIFQVGENKESAAYIAQKKKFGERIGAHVVHLSVPAAVTEHELILKIKEQNADPSVHGIIVQLPLPPSLESKRVVDAVDPEKDIDGLTSENEQLFRERKPRFIPATARGVIELLERYEIPYVGKKAAVLGRSALVGAPTALLLEGKGALVTVCHSGTENTKEITRASDVVVVAIGRPKLIGADYFRSDRTQAVIDVGINAVTDEGKLKLAEEIPRRSIVGDVDFDAVKDMVAAISPVPGGVGPMTVAALFENLMGAFREACKITP